MSASAVIRLQEGRDVREELFYCLAENRLPILELQVTARSLEEIFLELTAGDGKEAEKEGDGEEGGEEEGSHAGNI